MISDQPTKIIDGLYMGNINHANNQNFLQRLGITHVLTVCPIQARHFGRIVYKHVNVNDDPGARIYDKFEDCNKFISNAISNRGKVLVHCYAGVSRSAAITIAYIMKTRRLSFP